jgi:hypothetical protein
LRRGHAGFQHVQPGLLLSGQRHDASLATGTRIAGPHTSPWPSPDTTCRARTSATCPGETTEVRDHLAVLAAERGTTIGALVAAFSASQLTEEERAERQRAGREAMRRHLPNPPSGEEGPVLAGSEGALERFYAVAAEPTRRGQGRAPRRRPPKGQGGGDPNQ